MCWQRLLFGLAVTLAATRYAAAQDQETASQFVVTAEAASLRIDAATVGTALLGEVMTAKQENGEWLWVEGTGRAGWIRRRDVTPEAQATVYFTDQIKRHPNNARLYHARAKAWDRRGEAEIALADYSEAVRLAPKDASLRIDRGLALVRAGDHQQAQADFNEALRLDPQSVRAYTCRASAWYFQGEHAKAISDYRQAIRLRPDAPLVHNNLAWLLATCPEKQFRDGTQAVAEAKRACELDGFHTHWYLGTLAAASAEAGDYQDAVYWQSKALSLLVPETQDHADAFARLELFRANQPYREYDPQVQTARRPKPLPAPATR